MWVFYCEVLILVFDEVISFFDGLSEWEIVEMIEWLMGECMVVLVSYWLSMV